MCTQRQNADNNTQSIKINDRQVIQYYIYRIPNSLTIVITLLKSMKHPTKLFCKPDTYGLTNITIKSR